MGWTFLYEPEDEAKFIRSIFEPYRIVKARKVGTIWFVATELEKHIPQFEPNPETGNTTLLWVVLTKRSNWEFGYKDMSEDMGPNAVYARCPKSVLKVLSPTTNEYALRFREDCLTWANRPKLKVGDRIRIASKTYKKRAYPLHRNVFLDEQTGQLVRLSAQDVAFSEVL